MNQFITMIEIYKTFTKLNNAMKAIDKLHSRAELIKAFTLKYQTSDVRANVISSTKNFTNLTFFTYNRMNNVKR